MLKYVIVGEDPETGRVEDWYAIAPTSKCADELCLEAEKETQEYEYTWYVVEEME